MSKYWFVCYGNFIKIDDRINRDLELGFLYYRDEGGKIEIFHSEDIKKLEDRVLFYEQGEEYIELNYIKYSIIDENCCKIKSIRDL